MTHGKGKVARVAIGGMAVIAVGAWLRAQYQVQQPVTTGRINPQVSSELYGQGTVNAIKYNNSTSVAMPSEVLNAYWKSGALPSDVRMGYAALGPLTPGGTMAYIPPPPSYLNKPPAALPPALGAAAYGTGATVRYSSPAPSSVHMAPSAVSSAAMSSGPLNAGPINNSVRYGR